MAEIDWAQMFGVEPEDRERWEKMEAAAKKRIERGGGVDRIAREVVEPGLNLAQHATRSRMQAAQIAGRDDARTTRRKRTVVEEQTEFIDDEPEFG
ncbi:hypothetical protein PWG71_21390 [Nocardiopsis sp. N85]|uniref:hypothetical protein n=1 Tax=Nocardiopsis sp. N85 TaxID=3029400 RepID=UPI00237EF285|nr:hypothetical protein [Nocardiopsis sp. N85]MDE3723952.1 hypothetical protein [Nocardiopsis sp. N85]